MPSRSSRSSTKPLCRTDLTERVTFQRDVAVSDTQGGRAVAPAELDTVWAAVIPWATQSDETVRAGATTSTSRYRVRTPYRVDVTPAMRLLWTPYGFAAPKTLEISAVNIVSRTELSLDCVEVAF